MKKPAAHGASASRLGLLSTSAAIFAFALATPGYAQSNTPIKIAVIAEAQAVAGSSIPQAAQLAADEINTAGGVDGRKIEIISYDNHSSAAESVRAFQRAATEDHVNAVIASYISEVVSRPRTLDRPAQNGDGHARRRLRCDHPEHRQGL